MIPAQRRPPHRSCIACCVAWNGSSECWACGAPCPPVESETFMDTGPNVDCIGVPLNL